MIMDNSLLLNLLNNKTVIDSDTSCWLWIGTKSSFGHGRLCLNGTSYRVHRLRFCIENNLDYDDKSFQVNHKPECPHANCSNLEHLYRGTQSSNMCDRYHVGIHPRLGKFKTVCKYSHDLTGDNLYTYGKQRGCRLCRIRNSQEQRNKSKLS